MRKPLIRIIFLLFLPLLMDACKPRCPIESCQTKMVHTHSGKEFRGMPWYKKQNPKTGELDPVLNRDGKKY